MYTNTEYARSRLTNTVVRAPNGQPIYINSVGGPNNNIRVSALNLLTEEEEAFRLSDLDLTPAPLGYINVGGVAKYLSRAPMRRDWHQGLRYANIRVSDGSSSRDLNYRDVAKTIIGSFPTLERCIKKIQIYPRRSYAFSRSFCLKGGGEVWYKGQFKVGHLENVGVNVDFDKQWVREELEGVLG